MVRDVVIFECSCDDGCKEVLGKSFEELAGVYPCLHELGLEGCGDK